MTGRSIAFIGGRGAGKSRISRKFGKLSGRLTLSTDTLVCYEAGGLTIARIVEREGWVSFRNREAALLEKVVAMQDLVIDCGGGILVDAPSEANGLETLSTQKLASLKKCEVIYVKRDMTWLLEKALADANRPDLGGTYRALLERRLPWYEAAADCILDMRAMDTDDAIETLVRKYGRVC